MPAAPPLIIVSLFALHPDAFTGLMWVKGGVQDVFAELESCRRPARTPSLLQIPLQMQEEALGARGHPRDLPPALPEQFPPSSPSSSSEHPPGSWLLSGTVALAFAFLCPGAVPGLPEEEQGLRRAGEHRLTLGCDPALSILARASFNRGTAFLCYR